MHVENQPADANLSEPNDDLGQEDDDTQPIFSEVITHCNLLVELHRQRQDLHRAEKSLTLQIKAKLRRLCEGDKDEADRVYKSMLNGCSHELATTALVTCSPFVTARSVLEKERKGTEKQMTKAAKALPVHEWVKAAPGFGEMGLASIVGEAGDLRNYKTVSRLWKRMGLAVINGGRQRRVTGPDALLHGYSPSRRSVVWQYGDSMLKCKGRYRDVYLERLATEHRKALDEGLIPATSTKATADSWAKRGLPELTQVKKITEEHRSAGHMHNRAKRYMEKRLLRDLWAAWRNYS